MSDQAPAYPKRLIEVDLPIARISAHARREKSIRHGHISTLHIWWARRPLAACRAVICAALWPDPVDELCPPKFRQDAYRLLADLKKQVMEGGLSPDQSAAVAPVSRISEPKDEADLVGLRKALLEFIAEFANWDLSTNKFFLETTRALTQSAHESLGGGVGTRPLVVDPFAGGGSIPLEALRVGADAFASDLNPVPVVLNKVLLEYIPKYGQKLADEVRKWGEWINNEAEKKLGAFYPRGDSKSKPLAYLWARTILSEAPGEGGPPVEVPLFRSMWLAKKKGRYQALRWKRQSDGTVECELSEVAYSNNVSLLVRRPLVEVFEPSSVSEVESGPSRGGAATCPITGYTTTVESVRRQLAERSGGARDARLMCVVAVQDNASGRVYRLPTSVDIQAAKQAADELDNRVPHETDGLPTIPDGELNHLRGFFNVVLYGMTRWGDLFSPRQKLILATLTQLTLDTGKRLATMTDRGFAEAVQTCLALTVSRHADINASLSMWHNTREIITHVFGRQALPIVWDFAEANPFSGASGAYLGGVDWVSRVLEQPLSIVGQAEQASATEHPLPEDSADAVFTDPPYYAAIPKSVRKE